MISCIKSNLSTLSTLSTISQHPDKCLLAPRIYLIYQTPSAHFIQNIQSDVSKYLALIWCIKCKLSYLSTMSRSSSFLLLFTLHLIHLRCTNNVGRSSKHYKRVWEVVPETGVWLLWSFCLISLTFLLPSRHATDVCLDFLIGVLGVVPLVI